MTEWRSRIIGYGEEDPEQLLAHPMNHRIHSRAQQDALSTVLGKVGIVQNIVVNQRTGFCIDGHLRIGLALRAGQKSVPITYVDLSDDEERIVLASLDAIGAMAVQDTEKLAELIQSVESEDADILKLLAACAGEKLPDMDESMPPGEPKTMTCPECGHVWES